MSDKFMGKCRRHDHVKAAYVNAAMSLAKTLSLARAERMLLANNVAFSVILRALYSSGPVRATAVDPDLWESTKREWSFAERRRSQEGNSES